MFRITKTFAVCSLSILFALSSCWQPHTDPDAGRDNDAGLISLDVSEGSLSPDFVSDRYDYSVSVGNSVSSISVIAVAQDERATITVNGVSVRSGESSPGIDLCAGDNEITVTVSSPRRDDGEYVISVSRALSSNARLAVLSVGGYELSPCFSPETGSYALTVANCVDSVYVEAVAEDGSSAISINDGAAVTGCVSQSVCLGTGNNRITVSVYAQDGSANSYAVTVDRLPSDDATLKSLSVSSGTLSPPFSAVVADYELAVGNTVRTVTLVLEANAPNTTMTVRAGEALPVRAESGKPTLGLECAIGTTPIEITVTAENGFVKTYTITVTRANLFPPDSVSASVSDLSRVVLTWSAAADAETYIVLRSTNADTGYAMLAETSDLSCDDSSAVPGTRYYYRVKSRNSVTGESAESPSCTGYRIIASPRFVEATDGLQDRITVTWEGVEGAIGYSVHRAVASTAAYSILEERAAGTSFEDTESVPGILYAYKVKALGANVSGDFSAQDTGFRNIDAPSNLVASDNLATRQIDLIWSQVSGADLYLVFRSSVSSVEGFDPIGNTTTPFYTDNAVEFDKTYYYRVKASAESAGIESAYSNTDSGSCRILPPSWVNATDTLPDKIKVTWEAVPGAERYLVIRTTENPGIAVNAASSAGAIQFSVSPAPAFYDDTSALPGAVYYYTVAAAAGKSTAIGAYDQGLRVFAPPSEVDASTGYSGMIYVQWKLVQGASQYKIYRASSSSGADLEPIWSVPGNQDFYSDKYSKSPSYYYMITASNANGSAESAKSLMVKGCFYKPIVGTIIEAPVGIKASDGTFEDRVRVTWAEVYNAAKGYRVLRLNPDTQAYEQIGTTTSTSFDDMAISKGRRYFYKLQAMDSPGFSYYDTGYAE